MPSDQYQQAVAQALQRYPWLKRLGPIMLTSGEGPYEAETYMPNAEDNPNKGSFTIQLRSAKAKANEAMWPDLIASEGLDYLARSDPTYQQVSERFRKSMTPAQREHSYRRYQREVQQHGESRSFDDFLNDAEIQEYVRGYLFPKAAPGWTGPGGEGNYTPEQIKLLTEFARSLR